jgi:hypothetical protein
LGGLNANGELTASRVGERDTLADRQGALWPPVPAQLRQSQQTIHRCHLDAARWNTRINICAAENRILKLKTKIPSFSSNLVGLAEMSSAWNQSRVWNWTVGAALGWNCFGVKE